MLFFRCLAAGSCEVINNLGTVNASVECTNVHKDASGAKVLSGVTFNAAPGAITMVLGPSGCGKTMLLNILAGLTMQDSGSARIIIDGKPMSPTDACKWAGFVSQENALYTDLSLRENAAYFAGLRAMTTEEFEQEFTRLLGVLQLTTLADKPVGVLSGGQQRRANILVALLHKPSVVFLDEPTTGLDPNTRAILWQMVRSLRENGTCVVFTTHYLNEAEALSDAIVIIANGVVAASGTAQGLKESIAGTTIVKLQCYPGEPAVLNRLATAVAAMPAVSAASISGSTLTVSTSKPAVITGYLSKELKSTDEEIVALDSAEPTLEDVFSLVTNRRGVEIQEKRA